MIQLQFGDLSLKIEADDTPTSPREWCNLGTMVCFHSRYNLGDKHNYRDADEFMCSLLQEAGDMSWMEAEAFMDKAYRQAVCDLSDTQRSIDRRKHELVMEKIQLNIVLLPLFLYDHSGLTMMTSGFSCRWDSGQVGWIYTTKERILAEYGGKYLTKKLRARAEGVLRSEVKVFDQYLSGEVYGYVLEGPDGDLDSCWGFYGDREVRQEAISMMAHHLPNVYETPPLPLREDLEFFAEQADCDGLITAEEYAQLQEIIAAVPTDREYLREEAALC